MGYVVLHLDKAPGNEVRMTAHIERKQMPPNAIPSLTYLNEELVEFPTGVTDRTEAIIHRLEHAGLTRKIGTNQVRAIRIMLTGSHDDMKRIAAEGRIKEWCTDNLDWLRKTYGAENVVSAVLHLDEATPHIHATVVPIVTGERRKAREKKTDEPGKRKYRKKSVARPRLCADDVMTRVKLKAYQDSYAEAMAKYGLQRGIDGSEARHVTTQEFYRNAIAQKQGLQDNIGEYVRSVQEQKICFILSSFGVKFRYEEPYEHPVADAMHSQYKPDFSIYFERDGKPKRIYLEHFGVDEYGLVPAWFAKDRNISYEEANQKYNDGITWKRAAHEKFGTRLITTSSADFYYSDIKEKLKTQLSDAGVPLQERTDTELYGMVLPEGSKQEKAFIRLIATFATLLKSSCRSLKEVLKQTDEADDSRSEFVIKNIFRPVYERYTEALRNSGQIDFTDAILQATDICRASHPVTYDYIIVDEFQDISVDRYNFLKALREGNPPAKLYCVGDDWQSIYRFSGSDIALFNDFASFFGPTEINKIETTYRFGEPLVALSAQFIQRNTAQIQKNIRPFSEHTRTELSFQAYARNDYCNTIGRLVASIPTDKSVFLLGRYSFDDYYLSFMYKSVKEGNRFYYIIGGRKIEFLTVHKSKGLEADYVILLQCNKDTYGFPSRVSDDPALQYVLTASDRFPYGEERRLFYVAITRAKDKTWVLYDTRFPSVFVDEFLRPEKVTEESYAKHPNANKRWTRRADQFLLTLHREGKSIKYIAEKMGRSQTSIVMRLENWRVRIILMPFRHMIISEKLHPNVRIK